MSIFNFEADPVVHDGGIEVKGIADAVGQSLRITRFEQNNVAANLTGERLGRSQRHQVAFVHFGELDAALHASGESLYAIVGTVEQSDAREDLVDARFQVGAAQAVEVSLMPEVFVGSEFGVNALSLEDDADMAAQGSGLANGVEDSDRGAA